MWGCESGTDGRTERLSGVYNFARSGGDDAHNHDDHHVNDDDDDDDDDGSEYDDALWSKTRIWDHDDIIWHSSNVHPTVRNKEAIATSKKTFKTRNTILAKKTFSSTSKSGQNIGVSQGGLSPRRFCNLGLL